MPRECRIGTLESDSAPPAMMTSAWPSAIWSAASVIAWLAEAQARLTVNAWHALRQHREERDLARDVRRDDRRNDGAVDDRLDELAVDLGALDQLGHAALAELDRAESP